MRSSQSYPNSHTTFRQAVTIKGVVINSQQRVEVMTGYEYNNRVFIWY